MGPTVTPSPIPLPLRSTPHRRLNLVRRLRNPGPQNSRAGRRNEYVVLDAHAPGAAPAVELVVVDERGVRAGRLPLVDQRIDEVEARLDRHHEARLQAPGEAQETGTELRRASELRVVADAILPERLAVVDVEAQRVAKAMDEEKRVRAGRRGLLRVAPDDAQSHEAFDHYPRSEVVHLAVGHSWPDGVDGRHLAGEYRLVKRALAFRECPSDG